MVNDQDRKSKQAEDAQAPGDMASFNQRREAKSTGTEDAVKKDKDEREGYMDYNGNSEAAAPARARD